jgi:hypothetical protein
LGNEERKRRVEEMKEKKIAEDRRERLGKMRRMKK